MRWLKQTWRFKGIAYSPGWIDRSDLEADILAAYPEPGHIWSHEHPAQGIKKDAGKPALDLIDPYFVIEIGKVLTFGATKYEPGNWRKGMAMGKALAGVLRHVYSMLNGEYADPETGLSHAAHAACGLMFAFYYVHQKMTDVPDDRWTK